MTCGQQVMKEMSSSCLHLLDLHPLFPHLMRIQILGIQILTLTLPPTQVPTLIQSPNLRPSLGFQADHSNHMSLPLSSSQNPTRPHCVYRACLPCWILHWNLTSAHSHPQRQHTSVARPFEHSQHPHPPSASWSPLISSPVVSIYPTSTTSSTTIYLPAWQVTCTELVVQHELVGQDAHGRLLEMTRVGSITRSERMQASREARRWRGQELRRLMRSVLKSMKLLWRSWDRRPEGDRGVKDIKLACLGLIHRINVYIWTIYQEPR